MADIGANTLFLSAYYGLSLLWDEYAATGSTDMKFVPYGGTSVSFHGNNRFPPWERPFPLMETEIPPYELGAYPDEVMCTGFS